MVNSYGLCNDFLSSRIGDIVIGGSLMVLVYVTVAILLTLRRPLLIMNTKEEMLRYLQQVFYLTEKETAG